MATCPGEKMFNVFNRTFLARYLSAAALLLAACAPAAPASPTQPPAAPSAAPSPATSPGAAASPAASPAAQGLQFRPAPAPVGEPPASLVEAARGEGGLLWYESTPTEQMQPVLDAFKKKYPFVTQAEHVRSTGGNDMSVRIAQEAQAGQQTADVATNSADFAVELNNRGLLESPDWAALGIPKELTPEPYVVATTASTYVILYNTNLVSETEAPKNWNDLLDPKWKGKIGTWVRTNAIASLVPLWGLDRATDYMRKFAAQSPRTYESTFPLAQAVGAGEIPVGLGIYHSTQPAIAAGAPIKVVFPDPTSLNILYSFMPKAGKNPNTGKLFIHWLASADGARAYEQAAGRGNPLIPGTATAEVLKGRTLSDFPPAQATEFARWTKDFEAIMKQGG